MCLASWVLVGKEIVPWVPAHLLLFLSVLPDLSE